VPRTRTSSVARSLQARWLLASVTVGVLAVLAVVPAAGAKAGFGFNDNAGLYGQVSPARAASEARTAGADSVRLTVDWRNVEAQRGQRDWAAYDRLYEAALAHGQRPLFVVLFAPAWARPPGACAGVSDCTAAPAREHDGQFASFAAAVAARYPQAVGIEVWNEPNLRHFWGGGDPDPARYTELLQAVHGAVKRVAPRMPVIAGGLAAYAGEAGSDPGMGIREFLDGMYRAGAHGHYDGLSLHPYTSLNYWYGFRALTLVKEAQAAHGDRAPLWFTELNVSTTGPQRVSPADQARWARRVVPRLRARPDVAGLYLHTLYEPTWMPPDSEERGFGVIGVDGRRKPAFCALAIRLRTLRCPLPRPDSHQAARWAAQERLQVAAEAAIGHRAQTGSYAGLTVHILNRIDPSLRAQLLAGDAEPGAGADPARIAVFTADEGRALLLCNASRADRSYCIYSPAPGSWMYGSWAGSVYTAAGAVTTGSVWWW